ncbi:MAG: hypothetical protein J6X31_03085 [Bacteroidales bacterium]|nr:hypothetical protein [Bacteroidales bacterium]
MQPASNHNNPRVICAQNRGANIDNISISRTKSKQNPTYQPTKSAFNNQKRDYINKNTIKLSQNPLPQEELLPPENEVATKDNDRPRLSFVAAGAYF